MGVNEAVHDGLAGRVDLVELDAHADAAIAPGDVPLGVDVALRNAGVEEGDTVSIGEFELEWQE